MIQQRRSESQKGEALCPVRNTMLTVSCDRPSLLPGDMYRVLCLAARLQVRAENLCYPRHFAFAPKLMLCGHIEKTADVSKQVLLACPKSSPADVTSPVLGPYHQPQVPFLSTCLNFGQEGLCGPAQRCCLSLCLCWTSHP